MSLTFSTQSDRLLTSTTNNGEKNDDTQCLLHFHYEHGYCPVHCMVAKPLCDLCR